MGSDARMALVKEIFDEFVTKGSADLLFEHLAEDAVWRATAPAGTPLDEAFIGREGVMEYFRRANELASTDQVVVKGYAQRGDKIVALGSEQLCARRTGRAERLEWETVFSFVGGRIAEVLVIEDLSLLADA